ncbi:transposase [Xenorhabdus sp. PB61.4]|uniref:transposase n=1 Tax=Xenorhabdus sp. PB61.4 TaxID=2788940 RepID=UPI001E3E63B0|nr:transposase [Xenorhabdus sp. PB61.4]
MSNLEELYCCVDDCGELLAVKLTAGNTDDRQPVKAMTKGLTGCLYGGNRHRLIYSSRL